MEDRPPEVKYRARRGPGPPGREAKRRREDPPPRSDAGPESADARWILLIHQIPPSPAYLRVKVGRQLARIGAVAIKNSVYVLPRNEQTQEDDLFHGRAPARVSGGNAGAGKDDPMVALAAHCFDQVETGSLHASLPD